MKSLKHRRICDSGIFKTVFTVEKYQTDQKVEKLAWWTCMYPSHCLTIINTKQIHFIYPIHFPAQIVWSQSETSVISYENVSACTSKRIEFIKKAHLTSKNLIIYPSENRALKNPTFQANNHNYYLFLFLFHWVLG